MEKGLNPASYFSLNFYDPVNKLLGKYGAQKVFLEGDAIILAILEREGEPGLAVSRACVLAREIIEIVRGYNELMQRSGMPELELGIGITLQESAPLYLMDGERQIMISEALNESDRLSSCNKRARKVLESQAGPFHVYVFQAAETEPGANSRDQATNPEDSVLSYNLGGIRMNEAAFRKLEQEISLEPLTMKLTASTLSDKGEWHLSIGTVPVDRDIFRKIVVRESRMPQINVRRFFRSGLERSQLLRSLHRSGNLRHGRKEKSCQSVSRVRIYLVGLVSRSCPRRVEGNPERCFDVDGGPIYFGGGLDAAGDGFAGELIEALDRHYGAHGCHAPCRRRG